jgi:hypothetical protein
MLGPMREHDGEGVALVEAAEVVGSLGEMDANTVGGLVDDDVGLEVAAGLVPVEAGGEMMMLLSRWPLWKVSGTFQMCCTSCRRCRQGGGDVGGAVAGAVLGGGEAGAILGSGDDDVTSVTADHAVLAVVVLGLGYLLGDAVLVGQVLHAVVAVQEVGGRVLGQVEVEAEDETGLLSLFGWERCPLDPSLSSECPVELEATLSSESMVRVLLSSWVSFSSRRSLSLSTWEWSST